MYPEAGTCGHPELSAGPRSAGCHAVHVGVGVVLCSCAFAAIRADAGSKLLGVRAEELGCAVPICG